MGREDLLTMYINNCFQKGKNGTVAELGNCEQESPPPKAQKQQQHDFMVMKMIQRRGMSRMYLNSMVSYIFPRIPSQLLCLFLALSPLVGKTTSLVKCSTSVSKVPLLLLPQTCNEHTLSQQQEGPWFTRRLSGLRPQK